MFNLDNYNIILASQSPRRQTLLKELGIDFTVKVTHTKEDFPNHLQKEEIPLFLAQQKANTLLPDLSDKDILITADTIVWLDNKAVNKPIDREDAYHMIESLSGNQHTVYTAVQLSTNKKQIAFFASTKVFFSELSKAEIDYYIDKYQPFDKAGAYGIQEWIGYIGIEKIEGSYFNVMGFPVHQVYQHLKQLVLK